VIRPEASNIYQVFSQSGAERVLRAGGYLWHEGDAGRQVVLLIEGSLDILHNTDDGEIVVLRTVEESAVLGEMSCLEGTSHSATVRARTDCRLLQMSADIFRQLVRSHPELLEELLKSQSERLRTMTRRVTVLAFESVQERLVQYLLAHSTEGPDSVIHTTHQELAERIAATRESITKALGALSRQGALQLSRGRIRVLDRPALERLAYSCS